jgi:hypothetical protein
MKTDRDEREYCKRRNIEREHIAYEYRVRMRYMSADLRFLEGGMIVETADEEMTENQGV